jgi:hypothetical protein
MLKLNNSNQVYLLIITIIFLNFISVGWWTFMEKKRLIYTSDKFQSYVVFVDAIILTISIYLLSMFKISNIFILSLLYFYIVKKILQIFIIFKFHHYFISTTDQRKKLEDIFLDLALWTTRLFFLVECYILYFIFLNK